MKKYIKKMIKELLWVLDKIAPAQYRKFFPRYLKWLGVEIDSKETEGMWISPTVFLDSTDYSKIKIGKRVTISFDVSILIHDYSIVHAVRAIDEKYKLSRIIQKEVVIGDNVFIGAKSLILPGTVIGNNCIIGGGAVVKGKLEENSIYCGNPAKRIGSIEDYANRYIEELT